MQVRDLRRVRYFRCLVAFGWLVALPVASESSELKCNDLAATVVVKEPELGNRICSAAERAVEQLSDCGIHQTEPLMIEVVEGEIFLKGTSCLGIYHCGQALIQLVAPDTVEAALGDDHTFAEIPSSEFYDSIVVHEITHALVHQTRQGSLSSVVATEYLAYAMQIEFLSEETRTKFISNHPVTEPVTPDALNEVILAFSPAIFSIKAWKHFSQPENGCAFVRRLLNDEHEFTSSGFRQ